MQKFKVDRILSNNTNRKTVCLLGHYSDRPEESTLVVLEKKAFSEQDFNESQYFARVVGLEEQFVNDIYGNYELLPDQELNSESGHVAITGQFTNPTSVLQR